MLGFIKSILAGVKIAYAQDAKGNVYATKGESNEYPCVVCHVDEVHKVRKEGYKVVETDGIIYGLNTQTMSYEGIGADDKNGIWVCLKALAEFDIIKCAFFVSEEVGCIGSHAADMKFFDDCRFVLQCDRKGSSDFITNASCTELCSDEFLKDAKIDKFGYKEANGLMTDVMTLKENGLQVSACNISCGYYNPHSNNEMTRISDLENCYELVKHIISTCTKVYPHEYSAPKYSRYKGYDYYGGYYNSYSRSWKNDIPKCKDKILENLRDLNWSVIKDKDTYKVYDDKLGKYRLATKDEMYYAENIDDYRELFDYYDDVRFNKKGEVVVKDFTEKKYHAPSKHILDKIQKAKEDDRMDEFDEMEQHMYDCAMGNPDGFSLQEFKDSYSQQYPLLTDADYSIASEDVLGCIY